MLGWNTAESWVWIIDLSAWNSICNRLVVGFNIPFENIQWQSCTENKFLKFWHLLTFSATEVENMLLRENKFFPNFTLASFLLLPKYLIFYFLQKIWQGLSTGVAKEEKVKIQKCKKVMTGFFWLECNTAYVYKCLGIHKTVTVTSWAIFFMRIQVS